MKKVNTEDLAEFTWRSPNGTFSGAGKQVSEALGRRPESTDLNERHPFDVEITRLRPGETPFPFHSHSAQWEFYLVMSGEGTVRDDDGLTSIRAGDAFLFKPGQAHHLRNTGVTDLVICVVADNPIGESNYYPDSNKWAIHSPENRLIRSEPVDYYDGEE